MYIKDGKVKHEFAGKKQAIPIVLNDNTNTGK